MAYKTVYHCKICTDAGGIYAYLTSKEVAVHLLQEHSIGGSLGKYILKRKTLIDPDSPPQPIDDYMVAYRCKHCHKGMSSVQELTRHLDTFHGIKIEGSHWYYGIKNPKKSVINTTVDTQPVPCVAPKKVDVFLRGWSPENPNRFDVMIKGSKDALPNILCTIDLEHMTITCCRLMGSFEGDKLEVL